MQSGKNILVEYSASYINVAKNCLRKNISKERKELTDEAIEIGSKAICLHVKKLLNALNNYINQYNKHEIGLYWPLLGEPDLSNLMANLGIFSLPKVENDNMFFVKYKNCDPLISHSTLNIKQPLSNNIVVPKIIITPALALSINGHRLGFGKGHYDQYLLNYANSKHKIYTIGVCFHKWLFNFLPSDKNDYVLDYVITDQYIIKIS